MRGRLFNLVFGITGLASAAGHAAGPPTPAGSGGGRTIVMFGASWCAPCIAEMRNIAALGAAAAPDPILVIWSDDAIAQFAPRFPANVTVADEATRARLNRQFASKIVGLPYSVMLDAASRRCAFAQRGLTPALIGDMRRACRAKDVTA